MFINLAWVLFMLCLSIVNASYPVSECSNKDNENFKCYNGGICLQIDFNSTSTMKICSCKPGFTGRQCAQRTMPCSPDPCEPNGYCNSINSNEGSGYFCRCKPGYTGLNCQENINDCLNATCFNGGLCIDGINSYTCDCKWPFMGRYCQTKMKCNSNINENEENKVCKNNGLCIDDERNEGLGPRCVCQHGFEGIDCSIKVDLCKVRPCLNDAKCVWLRSDNDYKCECKIGFTGKNCQLDDVCKDEAKTPCQNNSTCINLMHTSTLSRKSTLSDDFLQNALQYYCQCKPGYTGINCDVKIWCNDDSKDQRECFQKNDSNQLKLNSISSISPISTTTTPTTTSTSTKTISVNTTISSNGSEDKSNGSFVLIVNIPPSEFRLRQNEIIREFEKKLGILMLIKKERFMNTTSEVDMIYPFSPNNTHNNNQHQWTKVYFIIIFACVYDETLPKNPNNDHICLQNNLNNLNDTSEIVNELKKASNQLMPAYVSNISYEAYSSDSKRHKPHADETFNKDINNNIQRNDQTSLSTTLVIFLAISLLVGISLALTVLIRQNAVTKRMMIKAPIWYPPPLNSQDNGFNKNLKTSDYPGKEGLIEMISQQSAASQIKYGGDSCAKQNNSTSSWLKINKKIDELSNFFNFSNNTNNLKVITSSNDNSCPITSDSGCSSTSSNGTLTKDSNSNEYSSYVDIDPPLKIRKLDIPPIYSQMNNNSASSSTSSSPSMMLFPPPPIVASTKTPEYYPSPPESLPDTSFTAVRNQLNPINFKGTAYGITPLMVFIMSRSKAKFNGNNNNSVCAEAEIVDTFFSNGADLNVQNLDGETALHLAARCGLYEICDRLIKNGAQLNTFDNYGRNVLHTAVCSNEINIVKLILNYCSIMINSANSNLGCNISNNDDKYDLIDSKTNDELCDTSLIIASRLNLNSIVQVLVDFNATINATDSEGRSALHWCAKVNNLNGALILLQAGANVNMQDNDEKTPLSSALNELCTQQVVELLIKYDAFVSTEDEFKYNKMKSILESNPTLFPPSSANAIKTTSIKTEKSSNLLLATTNVKENNQQYNTNSTSNNSSNTISKKIKPPNSVSIKRKLSETVNTNSSSNDCSNIYSDNIKNTKNAKQIKKQVIASTNNQRKTPPTYAPPTPSPPQQQIYSYQSQSDYQNSYNQAQYCHNQQMYSNPAFSYSFDNTDTIKNVINNGSNNNLGYLTNENSTKFADSYFSYANQQYTSNKFQQTNYPQSAVSHLELQKNAIYTTHNNLYFNTNQSESYAAYF